MARTDFSKLACTFRYHIFKTKSVTPISFCIYDTSNSLTISSRSFIKLAMLEDFRANVLKLNFGKLPETTAKVTDNFIAKFTHFRTHRDNQH